MSKTAALEQACDWAEIPLSRGEVAIVDAADYERLVAIGNWYATRPRYPGANCYASAKSGKVRMHKVVFGETGGRPIDHINGNTLDNRRSNLRLVDTSENNRNVRLRSHNTSGHPGVSWHKASNKWSAAIRYGGKQVHLGVFVDLNDAAAAYRDAAIKHHGAFSPFFAEKLLPELQAEVSALRERNNQLEANLLDYWAAHGAVKHIEEPRVVAELKARVRELEVRLVAARSARQHAEYQSDHLKTLEQTGRHIVEKLRAGLDVERARRKQAEALYTDAERECGLMTPDHEVVEALYRLAPLPSFRARVAKVVTDLNAARATVERVREVATLLRKRSGHWSTAGLEGPAEESLTAAALLESALTPPGDGGVL